MRSYGEALRIWGSWCRPRRVHFGSAAAAAGQKTVRRLETRAIKYRDLDTASRGRLDTYLHFLLTENEKYNLTGLKSFEDCVEQIVDDSALLIPLIETHRAHKEGSLRLIDVGSGAGIPGIILAILKDNWQVVCLEASLKKSNFISEAIQKCCLSNASVVRGRAEEVAHESSYREQFDVAISRGVGELRVISEYSLPFLSQGGVFLAPKGPNIQEEVNAAKPALSLLGGKLKIVTPVDSFGSQGQRTAIVIEKCSPTSLSYPRKAGIPSKRPL